MKSIETLDKIKDKLTQEQYDTIANDLRLLAKIWYACTCINKDEVIIDLCRDDGSIKEFVKRYIYD